MVVDGFAALVTDFCRPQMNARTRARETHSDESEAGSELRRETPSGGPEPGSELCELSSDESVPEALNRNRDEKQRQKYEQLFGETHVPHTPWERLVCLPVAAFWGRTCGGRHGGGRVKGDAEICGEEWRKG